jgi:hypothetical protein
VEKKSEAKIEADVKASEQTGELMDARQENQINSTKPMPPTNQTNLDELPVAKVESVPSTAGRLLGGSSLWILTLACLALAVGLVWWSLPETGKAIRIHFPEGHGLQAEDAVRFRGIDVGVVDSVALSRELDGVDVHVLLKPYAGNLAREGTRFWIVRPEFKLSGVSGLETAVGNKYIALSPGEETAAAVHEFSGLAKAPADVMGGAGLELILRGDKKFSVSPGSPVTFRGVDVGNVLDVGLSQDSRYVDVRVKVFEQHKSLVKTGSKFWATSGVNFDFSFREGMKLNTESLDTLARGGVSFLTTGDGDEVRPGTVFTLFGEPDEAWLLAANQVRMTDVELRGAVSMASTWSQKRLLLTVGKSTHFNGTGIITAQGERQLVFPRDVMEPQASNESSFAISVGNLELDIAKIPGPTPESEPEQEKADLLIEIGAPSKVSTRWIPESDIRIPQAVENCLAVRVVDDAATYFHLPIAVESLRETEIEGQWKVIDFTGDREVWHGAPVLSVSDGKLIGILLVENRATRIVSAARR